jgi:hypothetical protein
MINSDATHQRSSLHRRPASSIQKRWFRWGSILATICCLGCGTSEGPRLAVSGTITLDRQAVGPVLITLVPTSVGQVGCTCEATNGKFEIASTAGPTSGSYQVVVSPMEPDLEEYEARRAAGQKPFNSVVIPTKYQKPCSLLVDISAESENHLTLELSSR